MIKSANYIKSIVNPKDIPDDDFNHILFLGRSNVGKSSLINAITNRKKLAITSKTPGRTSTLNLFLINENIYLVDAPGYGYARRSKSQIEEFGKMIEEYLLKRTTLKKVFLLIDYKVGPTKDDLIMFNYLKHFKVETILIMTKIDKLNQKERSASKKRMAEHFKNQKMVLTSTTQKMGKEDLLKILMED